MLRGVYELGVKFDGLEILELQDFKKLFFYLQMEIYREGEKRIEERERER